MTMIEEDCGNRASGIRHKALRNAIYHTARRGWLEGWNRFYSLLVILGGSAAAAQMFEASKDGSRTLGFIIALIGALQLVWDFSGRARTHENLQRRYYALMTDVEKASIPTMADCTRWDAELIQIYADEPPVLRALDAIADNQATGALIGAQKPRLAVTRFQSLTRHILPHNDGTFAPVEGWQLPRAADVAGEAVDA